jgi:hypothetical protein
MQRNRSDFLRRFHVLSWPENSEESVQVEMRNRQRNQTPTVSILVLIFTSLLAQIRQEYFSGTRTAF